MSMDSRKAYLGGDPPRGELGATTRPEYEAFPADCGEAFNRDQYDVLQEALGRHHEDNDRQCKNRWWHSDLRLDPSDFQGAVPVPVAHPGEAKDIDLELLVKVLSRLRSGRAGGVEGVAA